MRENLPCQNNDKEIYRRVSGDYYSPSIHITEQDGIGIDVGGSVYVKPIETWHGLATQNKLLESQLQSLTSSNAKLTEEVKRKDEALRAIQNFANEEIRMNTAEYAFTIEATAREALQPPSERKEL